MAGVKNSLAKKASQQVEKTEKKNMKDWIVAMQPQIEKALPSVITAERFTRMALTAVSINPQLANCTPASFMGAMMQAAQLGLEPNTPLGQAYLLPYRNKGNLECQFQIGYKGLIDLAHRSGEFKNIEARVVYENDDFEYEYGLEPKLYHKPAMKNRGDVVCYYAVYTLVNGGFGFEVMSKEDIKAHAKAYSQSYNSSFSPWSKNFDEMAKKTVIKRVLKYAPIKTEFAREVATDNTIKSELSDDMMTVADENVYEAEEYTVTEDGEIIKDITAEEMAEIMAAEQQEMGL
jgi:recombination protein RecT